MRTAIIIILVATAFAQHKLNYIEQPGDRVSIDGLIKNFAQAQQEVFGKVFTHYIVEKVESWKAGGWSDNKIREELLNLIINSSSDLLSSMTNYMQRKLFDRLQMNLLTQSLQKQIKEHPQNFYLTFDIYDLLFD